MFSEGIAQRTIGQYPLSIATSLALEGLAGIHEDHPESPAPILKYEQLWVNMRTLFRNFMGSLEKSLAEMMDAGEAAITISEEMKYVEDIVRELNPNCKVMFYMSNYSGMESKYPKAVIRMDTTSRQKVFRSVANACLKELIDKHKGEENFFVYQRKLEKADEGMHRAAILTHYAYDLLSAHLFKRLDLIESHTGIVKGKALWYTKYYQGKDLVMIPFREDMMQIFGDNETFHPMDIRLRRGIIETANKYNWTQLTTTDRIRLTLEMGMKNHYAWDVIKELITNQ
jgi:hypothetical protein